MKQLDDFIDTEYDCAYLTLNDCTNGVKQWVYTWSTSPWNHLPHYRKDRVLPLFFGKLALVEALKSL